MEKNKRLATDLVLDALKQSGINVKRVTDEQARKFISIDENRYRARFSMGTPIFHSNAALALSTIRQDKATAAQWLAMLTKAGGIKAGEDRWTGLSEWLHAQGNSPLTRQRLSDYISANAIQIREEHFVDFDTAEESLTADLQREFNELEAEGEEVTDSIYREDHRKYAWEQMCKKYGNEFNYGFEQIQGVLCIINDEEAGRVLGRKNIDSDRINYTTMGLSDKKEIALHVPNIESWDSWDKLHFGDVGDGRCIAWIRFGTDKLVTVIPPEERKAIIDAMPKADQWLRQETGGPYNAISWRPPVSAKNYPDAHIWLHNDRYRVMNVKDMICVTYLTLDDAVQAYNRHVAPKKNETKTLVIDEIQSKRLQEAKEDGFRQEIEKDAPVKVQLEKAEKQYHEYLDELRTKYARIDVSYGLTQQEESRNKELSRLYQEAKLDYNNYMMEHQLGRFSNSRIPETPFLKNWHELCMKRMLRYAAENGFDQMVWVSGEEQEKRYDRSEGLAEIKVSPMDENGIREVNIVTDSDECHVNIKQNGHLTERMVIGTVSTERLKDILGKALTNQILRSPEAQTYKPEDLKIGGNGMRVFYDEVLPQFMNKYGKKWGVKTYDRTMYIDGSEIKFHGVNITPAMKQSVMQGQPMFMKDGNGKVYGWAMNGTIYLTKKGMNAETAIHEYTHLWANTMRLKDKHAWEHIKSLLRDTPIWTEVMKDPNYRHIRKNEDEVASEALARVSGRQNMEKLEQAIRQVTTRDSSLRGLQQVRQALDKFWSWVGRHVLNIRQARTITDVTDRILGDLLRGRTVGQQYPSTGTEETPRKSFRR